MPPQLFRSTNPHRREGPKRMIYRAIVSAILRKADAFLSEVKALVTQAKAEITRIEAAAKVDMQKVENELIDKIAGL